jgi:hypothetical protein
MIGATDLLTGGKVRSGGKARANASRSAPRPRSVDDTSQCLTPTVHSRLRRTKSHSPGRRAGPRADDRRLPSRLAAAAAAEAGAVGFVEGVEQAAAGSAVASGSSAGLPDAPADGELALLPDGLPAGSPSPPQKKAAPCCACKPAEAWSRRRVAPFEGGDEDGGGEGTPRPATSELTVVEEDGSAGGAEPAALAAAALAAERQDLATPLGSSKLGPLLPLISYGDGRQSISRGSRGSLGSERLSRRSATSSGGKSGAGTPLPQLPATGRSISNQAGKRGQAEQFAGGGARSAPPRLVPTELRAGRVKQTIAMHLGGRAHRAAWQGGLPRDVPPRARGNADRGPAGCA